MLCFMKAGNYDLVNDHQLIKNDTATWIELANMKMDVEVEVILCGSKKGRLRDANRRHQSVAAFHHCKHVTWFSSVTQEAKW